MSTRLRCAVVGIVVATVGAAAAPVLAASSDLSKQAKSAASIDELRASDAELVGAISVLDGEVSNQQKAVATAQQALDSANQAVQAIEQRLADIQTKLDVLKNVAADRAVDEYMRPRKEQATSGAALGDLTRRATLLQQVNGRDASALDELRAAKIDLHKEQKSAVTARNLADERRVKEQNELDRLNAARAEKTRLEASLQERIKAYAAEDEASQRVGAASQGRASRSDDGGGPDGRTSAAGLRWPTANHKVSSPFGSRWGRLHAGIDIEAKSGTPIYAAKGGTVLQAGWESGYGQYTCIDHGGGFTTCYAHQSRMTVGTGAAVQPGQLIGNAGNTGSSSGAHLHFETRVNGIPRDPMQYLP